MVEQTLQDQINGVIRRLTSTAGVPADVVESEVRERFGDWRDARVRDFVPIFVERAVRERLETDALAGEPSSRRTG